jgi:hypothetical protein
MIMIPIYSMIRKMSTQDTNVMPLETELEGRASPASANEPPTVRRRLLRYDSSEYMADDEPEEKSEEPPPPTRLERPYWTRRMIYEIVYRLLWFVLAAFTAWWLPILYWNVREEPKEDDSYYAAVLGVAYFVYNPVRALFSTCVMRIQARCSLRRPACACTCQNPFRVFYEWLRSEPVSGPPALTREEVFEYPFKFFPRIRSWVLSPSTDPTSFESHAKDSLASWVEPTESMNIVLAPRVTLWNQICEIPRSVINMPRYLYRFVTSEALAMVDSGNWGLVVACVGIVLFVPYWVLSFFFGFAYFLEAYAVLIQGLVICSFFYTYNNPGHVLYLSTIAYFMGCFLGVPPVAIIFVSVFAGTSEETYKRLGRRVWGPIFPWLFAVFELQLYMIIFGFTWPFFIVRCVLVLLHVDWAADPIEVAVEKHARHNMLATLLGVFLGGGASIILPVLFPQLEVVSSLLYVVTFLLFLLTVPCMVYCAKSVCYKRLDPEPQSALNPHDFYVSKGMVYTRKGRRLDFTDLPPLYRFAGFDRLKERGLKSLPIPRGPKERVLYQAYWVCAWRCLCDPSEESVTKATLQMMHILERPIYHAPDDLDELLAATVKGALLPTVLIKMAVLYQASAPLLVWGMMFVDNDVDLFLKFKTVAARVMDSPALAREVTAWLTTPDGAPVPQAGTFVGSVLYQMLIKILYSSILERVLGEAGLGDALDCTRVFASLGEFFAQFKELVVTSYDSIRMWYVEGKVHDACKDFPTIEAELDKLLTDPLPPASDRNFQHTLAERIKAVDDKIATLKRYANGKLELTNRHAAACARVQAFRDSIGRSNLRPEPVCFVFTGPAGTSKTKFVNELAVMCAHAVMPDGSSPEKHIRTTRVDGTKHVMDDFPQPQHVRVVVVDEIHQKKDPESMTAVLNFMHVLVGSETVAYPAASIEAKANSLAFTPDFALGCSNNKYVYHDLCGFDRVSVARRLHLVIEVNFADGRTKPFSPEDIPGKDSVRYSFFRYEYIDHQPDPVRHQVKINGVHSTTDRVQARLLLYSAMLAAREVRHEAYRARLIGAKCAVGLPATDHYDTRCCASCDLFAPVGELVDGTTITEEGIGGPPCCLGRDYAGHFSHKCYDGCKHRGHKCSTQCDLRLAPYVPLELCNLGKPIGAHLDIKCHSDCRHKGHRCSPDCDLATLSAPIIEQSPGIDKMNPVGLCVAAMICFLYYFSWVIVTVALSAFIFYVVLKHFIGGGKLSAGFAYCVLFGGAYSHLAQEAGYAYYQKFRGKSQLWEELLREKLKAGSTSELAVRLKARYDFASKWQKLVFVSGLLAVLATLYAAFRYRNKPVKSQGGAALSDDNVELQKYAVDRQEKVKVARKGVTANFSDLKKLVEESVFTVHSTEKQLGYSIASGTSMLTCTHMVRAHLTFKKELNTGRPDSPQRFELHYNELINDATLFGNCDVALLNLAGGSPFRKLAQHLQPREVVVGEVAPVLWMWYKKEWVKLASVQPYDGYHMAESYIARGFSYQLPADKPAYVGLCGAPIVCQTVTDTGFLFGFHHGGFSSEPTVGIGQYLNVEMLEGGKWHEEPRNVRKDPEAQAWSLEIPAKYLVSVDEPDPKMRHRYGMLLDVEESDFNPPAPWYATMWMKIPAVCLGSLGKNASRPRTKLRPSLFARYFPEGGPELFSPPQMHETKDSGPLHALSGVPPCTLALTRRLRRKL